MKKREWVSRGGIAVIAGIAVLATCIGACGSDRRTFPTDPIFEHGDASIDEPPPCGHQCSLDSRSVIDTCTGEIVETCGADLACGAGTCQEPCAAAAADRSSNGCEFYFQSPYAEDLVLHKRGCFASFITNGSPRPVEIGLEHKGQKVDVSSSMYRMNPVDASLTPHEGPLAAGESLVLFVSDVKRDVVDASSIPCPDGIRPAMFFEDLPEGTGIGRSLRLTASAPVTVATMYPYGGARSYISTAMLVLPVSTWGKEHVLVNAWEVSNNIGGLGKPFAQIMAAEDDTAVTIVPTRDIQAGGGLVGSPARVPATYRLGKGELLQLSQREELTGSIVTSDKPTSIVGGNSCAYVPGRAGACDILAQQIPALEQWGSEYVGVGYRPRMGNEHEKVPYRIVAARDGTRLDYDPAVPPGAPTTMSAGESVIFSSGTGDGFVVRSQDAEHPVYLAAYMSGAGGDSSTGYPGYGGSGDPEFVNVAPSRQYLSSYAFYADSSYAENSLVIVRSKSRGGDFKDVWLECAGNLTGWKPIGTRGEYEYTRVDLSRNYGPGDTFGETTCRTGVQRLRSEGPFTATLWGYDYYCSYAYPGGMSQRKLVDASRVIVN